MRTVPRREGTSSFNYGQRLRRNNFLTNSNKTSQISIMKKLLPSRGAANATPVSNSNNNASSSSNNNNNNASTAVDAEPRTSDFEMSKMPAEILPRVLHQWSVHHSPSTNQWIATLVMPQQSPTQASGEHPQYMQRQRRLQFRFRGEREARKFCKAYAPPKRVEGSHCRLCEKSLIQNNNINSGSNGSSNNNQGIPASASHTALTTTATNGSMIATSNSNGTMSSSPTTPNATNHRHYCRNCGIPVCEDCSARWGIRMVPKTYNHRHPPSTTVKVCRSCDWLSNAFCMALLQGRHADVVQLVETSGNVNLRTCFADIHGEALFPVHACVLGGNLRTLQWLVEGHGCPLLGSSSNTTRQGRRSSDSRPRSVQTSAARTLLDLAMKGRGSPKLDMLRYLIKQGLRIDDVQDASLAPQTLEAILKAPEPTDGTTPVADDNGGGSNTNNGNTIDIAAATTSSWDDETSTLMEDACALCCERPMDCVLTPCGHQICCTDCGKQIQTCPLCKINCSVLRIYRQ